MAKLRKPIAVEADNNEEKVEVVIEPSDIVGSVKLVDSAAKDTPAEETPAQDEAATETTDSPSDGDASEDTAAEIAIESSSEEISEKDSAKKEKKKKRERRREKDPQEKGGKRRVLVTLLCILVALSLLCLWILHDSNRLEKSFYQVKSSKVTDNIRIVCIADLHNKEFGADNERLVYEISKLNPDIIALVGDMIMEKEPDNYSSTLSLCKNLGAIAPVYFSLGNHEIDAMLFGGSNIYKDAKKQGIKIMNNETETVNIDGTNIDIIGLTQNPVEFEEYGKEFFEKAMEADDNFKLLLNHYPEQFLGVLDDYEIDLALAGHAHGGQVRLPWIGGLYAADQGFLPELCDGYHEIGNSKLIITRGLGKSGLCPRINNKPEIAVIDIGWY